MIAVFPFILTHEIKGQALQHGRSNVSYRKQG